MNYGHEPFNHGIPNAIPLSHNGPPYHPPFTTLADIYARHSGPGKFNDKGTVHSYIEIYEGLLSPYRETAKRVLEIGLFDGHSMRMWEEYFRNAEVHGIDCSDQPHGGMADLRPMIAEGTHHIHIFDATDGEIVEEKFKGTTFDVIIEDGSHDIDQQVKLYDIFEHYLSKDGLYIVEDIADLDKNRCIFETLGFEIIDRRKIRNRFDDVIAVIGGKK